MTMYVLNGSMVPSQTFVNILGRFVGELPADLQKSVNFSVIGYKDETIA